jgi:hypothetical protein
MAQQPLDDQTKDALIEIANATMLIRENTYNVLHKIGSADETLDVIDEQAAYITQLLPLIRRKLALQDAQNPVDIGDEMAKIPQTIAQLSTDVVMVPVLGIAAR